MSLPTFDHQIELLGLQGQRETLFEAKDRYRVFAEKIYPILVSARARLEACYPDFDTAFFKQTEFQRVWEYRLKSVLLHPRRWPLFRF